MYREGNYPEFCAFLVFYSIIDAKTLTNAETKWIPGIKHVRPADPFILVGTHLDARDDKMLKQQGRRLVTTEEANAVAIRTRAYKHIEYSLLTGVGANEILNAIVDVKLNADGVIQAPTKKKCTMM